MMYSTVNKIASYILNFTLLIMTPIIIIFGFQKNISGVIVASSAGLLIIVGLIIFIVLSEKSHARTVKALIAARKP